MKVKPTNKKLWKSFGGYVSIINTALSLILMFVSVPDNSALKIWLAAIFVVVLIALFCFLWWKANNTTSVRLKINSTSIVVKFGDILQQSDTLKVIPFNEYFDTIMDDEVISLDSLHGQYIQKYSGVSAEELRRLIDSDRNLKKHIAVVDTKRAVGSQVAYELGTVYKHNDYLLVAFSKFDKNNCAYLNNKQLWNCLINMWENLDIIHNGHSISLPLLGTGITRLRGMNLSEQQLLELLLVSLRFSGVKFNWNVTISIVVYQGNMNMINLYGLTEYCD